MAAKQAKKNSIKKAATKKALRTTGKTAQNAAPKSMPKAGRNPQGGLTKAGRDFFAKRDGSHLKPGVTGKADTPEKMLRKGSFLVRTFTHPRGPMVDPKGEPTRLALSAHAWGEKVPRTVSEAHTLAAKGHTLLAKYHAEQEKSGKTSRRSGTKTAVKKGAARKVAAKKSVGRTSATSATETTGSEKRNAGGRAASKTGNKGRG